MDWTTNNLDSAGSETEQLRPKTIGPGGSIYRPIQYLGNKVRALADITDEVTELSIQGESCLDLFSGSSVVSQALAQTGLQVTSVDSQNMCSVLANASLGVGRAKKETLSGSILSEILTPSNNIPDNSIWETLLAIEHQAIETADAKTLISLSKKSPLFWRQETITRGGKKIAESVGKFAHNIGPLITYTQAGFYFGIRQSLDIDNYRSNIERLHIENKLTDWQYHAALTALLSAMSSAVNSAGKHFAQPLIAGSGGNKNFTYKRLLTDRRISISDSLKKAALELNKLPARNADKHTVVRSDVNDFLRKTRRKYSLIYADPPYTAQQYSRFYHLLETAVKYNVPDMLHAGQITSGLYPKDRFLSQYCSKQYAPAAFHDLIARAKDMRAHLILSYSTSAKHSTGNARMVTLNELLSMCRTIYGRKNTRSKKLEHQYRQFNSSGKSNGDRNDPEVMVICNP